MMREIMVELVAEGIPFDEDGNHIRCFPHVVNIAVQTALKYLSNTSFDPAVVDPFADELASPQELQDNTDYRTTLEADVVMSARQLVAACRASGQRRDNFAKTIREGNVLGSWGEEGDPLRDVTLLRDMEIRWSSTYLMIDRVLELAPAIDEFLHKEKQQESRITYLTLKPIELEVLADIHKFLQIPHVVQELVSAEKTPTLSLVLPMYEQLIGMLRDLKFELPKLGHAIEAASIKLDEYMGKTRKTPMHVFAMGKFLVLVLSSNYI
ncbi:hypothetical protein FIBSPDRAFT_733815 [Athelia psychrophila]|uniref:hAT-like transposase RNase-H fold domain-containing protein n=1 Tax=Athelia psychrophila TaxID=1759441 RepID=A0A166NX33_9AGAM|nr:hypothetical protein FIBSPDRAFT_733815 [Fibularhizoctonia sp. CBS 109695]